MRALYNRYRSGNIAAGGGVKLNQFAKSFVDAIQNDASPEILNSIDKSNVNNFVLDLIAINDISPNFFNPSDLANSCIKAIWLTKIGSTQTAKKYNLLNPQNTDAAYRAVYAGTWSYDTGKCDPGGVSGAYADTKFLFTGMLNNAGITYYIGESIIESTFDVGGTGATNKTAGIGSSWTNSNMYYSMFGAQFTKTNINSAGLYELNRVGSSLKVYKDGNLLDSKTDTPIEIPAYPMRFGGCFMAGNSYGKKNVEFVAFHNAIPDVARSAWNAAIEAYYTRANNATYVVTIGDSIAAGYIAINNEGYGRLFAIANSFIYRTFAVSGYNITQITAMYNAVKNKIGKNAIILLQDSSNDTINDSWKTAYQSLVNQMIADGHAANKIYLIGPPYQENYISKNNTVNTYLTTIASETGTKLVLCSDAMLAGGGNTLMNADKIHPKDEGHAFIKNLIQAVYNS